MSSLSMCRIVSVVMAIRDRIIENARPWLEPGEVPQAAFAGQTFNGWWALLSIWIVIFKNVYRSVVVTDRRIIVFNTGRWTMTKAKDVHTVLDRNTVLGEPSGLWWQTDSLGEKLYVHRRFHEDIARADARIGAIDAPPLPPMPSV